MTTGFSAASYKETLLFLMTAGIVVPLFRRLKISPVLGFLAAGVVIGPFGLGKLSAWFPPLRALSLDHVEEIAPVAEFGVVFLLFMIGLELSFERLARMRKLVFGFGSLQVLSCVLVLGALAVLMGQTASAAAVLASAVALSSTAIAIPELVERKRLKTAAGRTIFSVLLFQDLLVAPLLFMVSILGARVSAGSGLGAGPLYALLPAAITLALIIGVGRLLLRPLFHQVALTRSTELFMAACLLVVIGAGVVAAAAGLSMALGAFIAGLLLAETEFRREIEVTIEPFKGLLLGLFFVSIGASLDLSRVWAAPLQTIGLALGLVGLKGLVIYLAARLMKFSMAVSRETAALLAPGGEFAFVMIAAAIAARVVPADIGQTTMVAVTLSMFALPPLAGLAQRLAPAKIEAGVDLAPAPVAEDSPSRVLIVGYGRVGRLVGQMLTRHKIEFVACDGDARVVSLERKGGAPVYWGNATRLEFLEKLGLAKARALVVTMNAPRAIEEIVARAREARPDLTIIARARDAHHATVLYKLGVTDAIPETIEASLQLSEAVLVDIGVPMGYVIASIHEKRDEFRKILRPAGPDASPRHAMRISTRVKDMSKPKKPEAPAQTKTPEADAPGAMS
jgi:CPA2 family monovalent cation:H+ antiporter-2